ncbi:MAG: hypothetical protein VX730_03430 [Pseudomonadota bacterium]|nr:hypothetical protein [Pseudomonadota bacterium]
MLIDGIFFSHGGASDIPGRKVQKQFGIISDLGRQERKGMSTVDCCKLAQINAYRSLAKQAAALGANAVLNVQIAPFPYEYSVGILWEAPISGNAVTLGDEE